MDRGIDTAGVPDYNLAATMGYKVAFRYLYNLTAREVAVAHASGIGIVLIAEFDTLSHHPIFDGAPAGRTHGQTAVAQAVHLGAPSGSTIVFTGDTNISRDQYIVTGQYGQAFGSEINGYLPMAYGGARWVQWMLEHGYAARGWVAGADAWNDGVRPQDTDAVAYQKAAQVNVGVTCDLNEIVDLARLGAWWPAGHKLSSPQQVPTTVQSAPTTTEEDMGRLFRTLDGSEYLMVYDSTAPLKLGWHWLEPQTASDLLGAGMTVQQLGVEGSQNFDAMFERYPILDGADARPAKS